MSRPEARYSVGIDLGTTNCVLARGNPEVRKPEAAVEVLSLPQLVAPGEVIEQPLLPSFFYLPGAHELPEGSSDLPWGPSSEGVVGEMARRWVGKSPDRVVHSAKSWLCHEGVDRRGAFLPRSPAELERRVSPVEASAAYLTHIRRAWDHLVAQGDRTLRLAEQDILLTVPASFGEAARQLTAEAARMAGLERLHLVEEPQAAFYSWLAQHSGNLAEALEGLQLILVVDVGGGTTDLTLIRVRRDPDDDTSTPQLERVAVGEHLMLGGDNMDLALAALAEPRLSSRGGARLDGRAWQALRQSCRVAREVLLAPGAPEVASVVIPGRGSSLIGGQRRVELGREEVVAAVLDGFFPEVPAEAKVLGREGLGLREWGLPYASDVAVTRQIAEFVRHYYKESKDRVPLDAVLFNGGVLNSPLVAQRLFDVIRSWTPSGVPEPRLLNSRSLDLAVACGAAHYGLVRRGRGLRIVSGLPQAVYIGLEVRKKGRGGRRRIRQAALCLAPRGLREGQTVELTERPLNLSVGREVLFPLYELKGKGGKLGEVRQADDRQLQRLPPLVTRLPGSGRRQVPVTLRATLSEVGTLEVDAVAHNSDETYRLEFDMRAREHDGPLAVEDESSDLSQLDPERVEQASAILGQYFAEESEPPRWKLLPRLENVLRCKKENWPLGTIRGFYEALRPDRAFLGGSPDVLATWYNLAGYCLRPGFGYPGDSERMEVMLPLLSAGCRSWEPRARVEWWVLWRRVAGGLERKTQQALFNALLAEMGVGRAGSESTVASQQELIQVWMLAASLERVAVKSKAQWGQAVLRGLETGAVFPEGFWCLGRVGSRMQVHGGIDTVVPTDRVEGWLERLLALDRGGLPDQYGLCLMLLSRRTDDRSRDIDDDLRQRVIERMTAEKCTPFWVEMVASFVEDEPLDQRVLGESLPPGLRLLA